MDVLELVRPEGVHRGHLGEEASLAAVGALVEHEARLAGDERAVRTRAGLELDHHPLAAVADGEELLATREDELDGPLRRAGERGDVALEVEVALRAEASTEQRHDDPNVRFGDLQGVRDAAARRVRDLGRRPDGDLVTLPLRDDRARLDRDSLDGIGHVASLDDDVGPGERRVCISLHDRRVPERVAVAAERLVALVVASQSGWTSVASSASAASKSVTTGQRLVVDLDQRCRLLGDLGGRRRDAGDDVALEAHRVLREEPPVLDHATVEDVGHVLVGHDGEHAGERARLRRVDARDPRMGVVGVAELRDELSRRARGRPCSGLFPSPSPCRPGG